jgi:transposase-like protein
MSKAQPRKVDEYEPEEYATARRMYARGYGVGSISVKLERSPKHIRHWVRDVKQGPRQRRRPEPWEIEAARKMRKAGVSIQVIAREFGRSTSTVSYWVRDLPKPAQPEVAPYKVKAQQAQARREERERVRAEKRQRALELYQAGTMSRRAIGREVGISVSTITAWVDEAGLELRVFSSRKLG